VFERCDYIISSLGRMELNANDSVGVCLVCDYNLHWKA
jgi:hypothetical protein